MFFFLTAVLLQSRHWLLCWSFYVHGLVLLTFYSFPSLFEMNLFTQENFIPSQLILSVQKMNRIITPRTAEAWNNSSHFVMITMQAQIYWVIIMDIVLSFILNMKNQAQYSPYILYSMFFFYYCLGKVVFLITTACLPAKEMVLFLYSVLKIKVFFLL